MVSKEAINSCVIFIHVRKGDNQHETHTRFDPQTLGYLCVDGCCLFSRHPSLDVLFFSGEA